VKYKRWLLLIDGLYADLSTSAEPRGLVRLAFDNATLHLSEGLLEGNVGYRLVDCDRAQLDLLAGFRLNYIYSRLDLSAAKPQFPRIRQLLPFIRDRSVADTETRADPIFGGRLRLRLVRPLLAYCRADIGGLDFATDYTWQINTGLELTTHSSSHFRSPPALPGFRGGPRPSLVRAKVTTARRSAPGYLFK
jgi:hypothetical protein